MKNMVIKINDQFLIENNFSGNHFTNRLTSNIDEATLFTQEDALNRKNMPNLFCINRLVDTNLSDIQLIKL